MLKKETVIRYLYTVIGIFFVALGIAFAKHSNLGISPVSSVANVLSIRFQFLSVGIWLMLWNCFMVLIQIIILRRDFKPIQFLQLPIAFLLGVFTDLCLKIVSVIPAEIYAVRLLLVLCGIVILAFGICLMIISDTVMNVGEAFVNVISQRLNKNFGTVKVVFDITCVALSAILSFAFFGKLLGTREGTILTACITGSIVKLLNKFIKEPLTKIITPKQ